MSLEYIQSQKGAKLLLLNGFTYRESSVSGSTTYWRCTKRNVKCTARCSSILGKLHGQSGSHNHTPHPAEIDVRKRISSLKQAARLTQNTTCQLVATATHNMGPSAAGVSPSPSLLTRLVQRTRKNHAAAPANPLSLTDLVIPDDYTKTKTGNGFLLFDSGSGNDRILIYTTKQNLVVLSQCDHWFSDGTFKTTPSLFKQLVTVQGVKSGKTLPLVYGLLPNKQHLSYKRFLDAITGLASAEKVIFQPQSIMTDFETGLINAFSSTFPTAEKRGCYFHHAQCIWKHLQTFPDILEVYTRDADFGLHVRQIAALAFVPVPAVESSFDILMDTAFFRDNSVMLRPLLDYYEDTWIGRPGRGRRRDPVFAHELWNCYKCTLDGNSRTNNSVEGWNRRFSTLVGSDHPTLWKFFEKIQEEQSLTEMKVNQIIAGAAPQPRRKKYRDLEERLLKIVKDYGNLNISE